VSRGPYVRALVDHGPGRAEHYPPGTYREPVIVRCVEERCPSAIAMPPGTPDAAQQLRLDIAAWTGGLAAPRCPHPADHGPAPEAITERAISRLVAVGGWLLLAKAAGGTVLALGGGAIAYILTAVLVSAAWWTFVVLCNRVRR
jgi:hypothetical protein